MAGGKNILTPEETAKYLKKSVSWVYKHAEELGGRKLGGSLFFPAEEDLYEFIFCKGKGWRYDFTMNGKRYTKTWFKTKREAKQAEAKRKEEAENPEHTMITDPIPTDMDFLELVNRRLDYIKAYNSAKYYANHICGCKALVPSLGKIEVQ